MKCKSGISQGDGFDIFNSLHVQFLMPKRMACVYVWWFSSSNAYLEFSLLLPSVIIMTSSMLLLPLSWVFMCVQS